MDVLRRAVDYIKKMWGNLTPTQRIVLGAAVAGVALVVVWGSVTATRDGMTRIAGPELRADDRYQIVKRLQETNQRHELRGEEILVPREDADRIVLTLAGEGVFGDDAIYGFLKQTDVFDTKWDKEARYKVALQRKLERMIRGIRGVRNASVEYTPGSRLAELGFKSESRAKASVKLELQPGHSLSRQNVAAIAGLVSHAIEGLAPDHVVITDDRGAAYRVPRSDGAGFMSGDLRDIEARYEDEIKDKLEAVLPGVGFVVRAFARAKDTQRESEKLGKAHPVEEGTRILVEKPAASGGAATIEKGATQAPGAFSGPARELKETDSDTKSKFDVERIQEKEYRETIERVTIGVLYPVQDAEVEAFRLKQADLKKMVLQVAGASDEAAVTILPVPTRPPAPIPAPTSGERLAELVREAGPTVAFVVVAIAALIVIYLILRAAIPKGVVEEIEALRSKMVQEIVPGMGEAALAEEESARMKLGVREMISRNPRGVAGIMKRWLTGK